MFSREDYMNKKCTHSEYYAQWADRYKQIIINTFTKEYLKEKLEQDEHLNNIPLQWWCNLPQFQKGSLSDKVCAFKEAARQIAEED